MSASASGTFHHAPAAHESLQNAYISALVKAAFTPSTERKRGPDLQDLQQQQGSAERYGLDHLHAVLVYECKQEPSIEEGKVLCTRVHGPGCTVCQTCHFCRQKTVSRKTECSVCRHKTNRQAPMAPARGHWCGSCLWARMGEDITEALRNPRWSCPCCRGVCNCSNQGCQRNRQGLLPTKQLVHEAKKLNYTSVAQYLVLNNLEFNSSKAEVEAFARQRAEDVLWRYGMTEHVPTAAEPQNLQGPVARSQVAHGPRPEQRQLRQMQQELGGAFLRQSLVSVQGLNIDILDEDDALTDLHPDAVTKADDRALPLHGHGAYGVSAGGRGAGAEGTGQPLAAAAAVGREGRDCTRTAAAAAAAAAAGEGARGAFGPRGIAGGPEALPQAGAVSQSTGGLPAPATRCCLAGGWRRDYAPLMSRPPVPPSPAEPLAAAGRGVAPPAAPGAAARADGGIGRAFASASDPRPRPAPVASDAAAARDVSGAVGRGVPLPLPGCGGGAPLAITMTDVAEGAMLLDAALRGGGARFTVAPPVAAATRPMPQGDQAHQTTHPATTQPTARVHFAEAPHSSAPAGGYKRSRHHHHHHDGPSVPHHGPSERHEPKHSQQRPSLHHAHQQPQQQHLADGSIDRQQQQQQQDGAGPHRGRWQPAASGSHTGLQHQAPLQRPQPTSGDGAHAFQHPAEGDAVVYVRRLGPDDEDNDAAGSQPSASPAGWLADKHETAPSRAAPAAAAAAAGRTGLLPEAANAASAGGGGGAGLPSRSQGCLDGMHTEPGAAAAAGLAPRRDGCFDSRSTCDGSADDECDGGRLQHLHDSLLRKKHLCRSAAEDLQDELRRQLLAELPSLLARITSLFVADVAVAVFKFRGPAPQPVAPWIRKTPLRNHKALKCAIDLLLMIGESLPLDRVAPFILGDECFVDFGRSDPWARCIVLKGCFGVIKARMREVSARWYEQRPDDRGVDVEAWAAREPGCRRIQEAARAVAGHLRTVVEDWLEMERLLRLEHLSRGYLAGQAIEVGPLVRPKDPRYQRLVKPSDDVLCEAGARQQLLMELQADSKDLLILIMRELVALATLAEPANVLTLASSEQTAAVGAAAGGPETQMCQAAVLPLLEILGDGVDSSSGHGDAAQPSTLLGIADIGSELLEGTPRVPVGILSLLDATRDYPYDLRGTVLDTTLALLHVVRRRGGDDGVMQARWPSSIVRRYVDRAMRAVEPLMVVMYPARGLKPQCRLDSLQRSVEIHYRGSNLVALAALCFAIRLRERECLLPTVRAFAVWLQNRLSTEDAFWTTPNRVPLDVRNMALCLVGQTLLCYNQNLPADPLQMDTPVWCWWLRGLLDGCRKRSAVVHLTVGLLSTPRYSDAFRGLQQEDGAEVPVELLKKELSDADNQGHARARLVWLVLANLRRDRGDVIRKMLADLDKVLKAREAELADLSWQARLPWQASAVNILLQALHATSAAALAKCKAGASACDLFDAAAKRVATAVREVYDAASQRSAAPAGAGAAVASERDHPSPSGTFADMWAISPAQHLALLCDTAAALMSLDDLNCDGTGVLVEQRKMMRTAVHRVVAAVVETPHLRETSREVDNSVWAKLATALLLPDGTPGPASVPPVGGGEGHVTREEIEYGIRVRRPLVLCAVLRSHVKLYLDAAIQENATALHRQHGVSTLRWLGCLFRQPAMKQPGAVQRYLPPLLGRLMQLIQKKRALKDRAILHLQLYRLWSDDLLPLVAPFLPAPGDAEAAMPSSADVLFTCTAPGGPVFAELLRGCVRAMLQHVLWMVRCQLDWESCRDPLKKLCRLSSTSTAAGGGGVTSTCLMDFKAVEARDLQMKLLAALGRVPHWEVAHVDSGAPRETPAAADVPPVPADTQRQATEEGLRFLQALAETGVPGAEWAISALPYLHTCLAADRHQSGCFKPLYAGVVAAVSAGLPKGACDDWHLTAPAGVRPLSRRWYDEEPIGSIVSFVAWLVYAPPPITRPVEAPLGDAAAVAEQRLIATGEPGDGAAGGSSSRAPRQQWLIQGTKSVFVHLMSFRDENLCEAKVSLPRNHALVDRLRQIVDRLNLPCRVAITDLKKMKTAWCFQSNPAATAVLPLGGWDPTRQQALRPPEAALQLCYPSGAPTAATQHYGMRGADH